MELQVQGRGSEDPGVVINVVSRGHAVVCRRCGTAAVRVTGRCPGCGASLLQVGFDITAVNGQRKLRRLLGHLRQPHDAVA